jgi:hypothetical protein
MLFLPSQAEPLYELVTATDFAYSSTVRQNMKRALEDFEREISSCHCAPCQGNGVPVLKGTTSRPLGSLVEAILWRRLTLGLVFAHLYFPRSENIGR